MPLAFLDPVCSPQQRAEDAGRVLSPLEVPALGATVLGANESTGIASDSGLPREVCTVFWADPLASADPAPSDSSQQLYVKGCSSTSTYHINDTLITGTTVYLLQYGSSLTIKTDSVSFEYRIRVHESSAASSSSPSTTEPHQAAEECMCNLCLEIQVQSTMIVPCGHAFCQECVIPLNNCPSCRGPLAKCIPCLPLDNIIQAMIKSSFFLPDDVKVYEERCGTNRIALPSSEDITANATSRKRRRLLKRQQMQANKMTAAGTSVADAITIE